MKKLVIAAALAIAAGCTTAHIKTPEWEATINSHWLKRDVDKLAISRQADGSYSVDLNGYKTDTSEQLPAFTREMWAGLAVLGRIAATTVNPVAGAANVANVEMLPIANANSQLVTGNIGTGNIGNNQQGSSGECANGECVK